MDDISISVIIPVYNVSSYLRQCLNSVLNQNFKNIEIICVEDCSTDDSLEILEEYKKKYPEIVIIKNTQNLGLGLSRNEGLKVAKGYYVHFLDSDDWLNGSAYTRLEKHLLLLKFRPDVLFFNYSYFDNIKKITWLKRNSKCKIVYNKILNPTRDLEAFYGWDRYAWVKLHKRKFLIDNSIYFNDYPCMEDVEFAAKVYVNCSSLCYVNENVLNYRTKRKGSLVTQLLRYVKFILKSYENNIILYKNLPKLIKLHLLGFDYYLVRQQILEAYLEGYISTLFFIYFLLKYNTFSVINYITLEELPHCKSLYINPLKIFLKKFAPSLNKKIISIKRKLHIY